MQRVPYRVTLGHKQLPLALHHLTLQSRDNIRASSVRVRLTQQCENHLPVGGLTSPIQTSLGQMSLTEAACVLPSSGQSQRVNPEELQTLCTSKNMSLLSSSHLPFSTLCPASNGHTRLYFQSLSYCLAWFPPHTDYCSKLHGLWVFC